MTAPPPVNAKQRQEATTYSRYSLIPTSVRKSRMIIHITFPVNDFKQLATPLPFPKMARYYNLAAAK